MSYHHNSRIYMANKAMPHSRSRTKEKRRKLMKLFKLRLTMCLRTRLGRNTNTWLAKYQPSKSWKDNIQMWTWASWLRFRGLKFTGWLVNSRICRKKELHSRGKATVRPNTFTISKERTLRCRNSTKNVWNLAVKRSFESMKPTNYHR